MENLVGFPNPGGAITSTHMSSVEECARAMIAMSLACETESSYR